MQSTNPVKAGQATVLIAAPATPPQRLTPPPVFTAEPVVKKVYFPRGDGSTYIDKNTGEERLRLKWSIHRKIFLTAVPGKMPAGLPLKVRCYYTPRTGTWTIRGRVEEWQYASYMDRVCERRHLATLVIHEDEKGNEQYEVIKEFAKPMNVEEFARWLRGAVGQEVAATALDYCYNYEPM